VLERGFCAEIIIGKCISVCSPKIARLVFKHLCIPYTVTAKNWVSPSELVSYIEEE